ncbi:MAG: hypothetical protein JSS79_01950 [Bacteroidetes bacterium]|nr:hypothetical protein [Bacteroidota bacterium]
MTKNNFQDDFTAHSVHDWEKVARLELGNKDPWQSLTKQTSGFLIKPYYDVLDQRPEENILLRDTIKSGAVANVPKVVAHDAKSANETALAHLLAGADGIYFKVEGNLAPNVLLKDVDLTICSVFFECRNLYRDEFIFSLHQYIEKHKLTDKINGAFFTEAAFKRQKTDSVLFGGRKFRKHGVVVAARENIVDEIVDALCVAVDIVEHHKLINDKSSDAFSLIAFSVSIDTNFFLSIAKIRALQELWITLQQAYGVATPSPVFVHGLSSPWIKESFQPHGNLLKQTTASMAAFMAGCDALTVEAEDLGNPMMVRIARNVSAILNDESHLGKVVDPLAGSYFVDHLTHEVAAAAWEKFQKTV